MILTKKRDDSAYAFKLKDIFASQIMPKYQKKKNPH